MLFPGEAHQEALFDEGPQLQYNMYLMSFKDLLDLPRMTPHQATPRLVTLRPLQLGIRPQVLLHKGRLAAWSDAHRGRVVFVSHEWLGLAHPDPRGDQLLALKDVVRRLASGKVTVQSDWNSQNLHKFNEKLSGEHAAKVVPNCLFWVDYSGVPQRLSAEDIRSLGPSGDAGLDDDGTPRMQLKAINSIPAYIERSALVFVLAPTCWHRDRSTVCDVSTWRGRGWCRVELLCAVLARTRVRLLKCDAGAGVLEFMAGPEVFVLPPGKGAFTCCSQGHRMAGRDLECDKVKLRVVMEGMVDAKVAHLARRGETLHQRLFITDRERYLGGLPRADSTVAADPIDALRRRLSWSPADDVLAQAGRAPSLLHWASRQGDAAAARALVAAAGGAVELERPMPKGLPEWSVGLGWLPLHLAAISADGSADTLKALLKMRANAAAFDRGHLKLDALMWAAAYGTPEHVAGLLESSLGWDVERRNPTFDVSAFTVAVFYMPSSAPVLRLLLERRALPRGGCGVISAEDTALLTVCNKDDSDPEAAKLLLEAKCSPDSVLRPPWRSVRLVHLGFCLAGRLAMAMGRQRSPAVLRSSEFYGATALGLAAFAGHLRVTEVLLQAQADPTRRNAMGHTPLESARARSDRGRAAAPLEFLLGGGSAEQLDAPRPSFRASSVDFVGAAPDEHQTVQV